MKTAGHLCKKNADQLYGIKKSRKHTYTNIYNKM